MDNQVLRWLDIRFPEFNEVFKDWSRDAAWLTLRHYPTPMKLMAAGVTGLINTWLFWFVALNLAKQILRNDLWIAKVRVSNMKELLLHMKEWHEKAVYGTEYDTWHAGRFLCEWASEETQVELRNLFGHFDRIDSWKALIGTITLLKRLCNRRGPDLNTNG